MDSEIDCNFVINLITSVLMLMVAWLSYKSHKNSCKIMEKANEISKESNSLVDKARNISEQTLYAEIVRSTATFAIKLEENLVFCNDANKMNTVDEAFFNYARIGGTMSVENTSDICAREVCFNCNLSIEPQQKRYIIPPHKTVQIPVECDLRDLLNQQPSHENEDKLRLYTHSVKMYWSGTYDCECDVFFDFWIKKCENNSDYNYYVEPSISQDTGNSICYMSKPKVFIRTVDFIEQ